MSGDLPEFQHTPVLLTEVLEFLGPALRPGDVVVDCTLGGGGHSAALLRQFESVELLGVDQDDEALEAAGRTLSGFAPRVRLIKSNFRNLSEVMDSVEGKPVGAVLYDLGVSSAQLDRPGRGFSYRPGNRLDMRMDRSAPTTAADVVNKYSEKELIKILFEYGEERFAKRIVRAIAKRRAGSPFEDSGDLAEVVRSAIPAATRRQGPHPARRTFQALRIEVNDELASLRESLVDAAGALRTGGRLAVISYHSLEDRIVKNFMRNEASPCTCPPDFPVCVCGAKPRLRILTNRPVRPGQRESKANLRSSSARMRVAEKLEIAA